MSDLSGLSDAELMQRYQLSLGGGPAPTPPDFTGTRLTVGAAKPSGLSDMSDADLMAAYAKSQPMGMGEDIARSAGSGLAKGMIGLAGLPDALSTLAGTGADKAASFVAGKLGMNYNNRNLSDLITGQQPGPGPIGDVVRKATLNAISPLTGAAAGLGFNPPSSAQITSAVENNVTGPLHQPQSVPGHYAQTIGEFLPGAVMAPGGVLGNAIRYGVLPGLASETAGQVTKGSAFEQPARVGAALATGGLAGLTSRPGTAAQSIRAQMPAGVTEQMVNDAHALMTSAAQQGVNLSWAEALSHVAGRPVLSDTVRHLEAAGSTQARMADFFSGRPQQIEAAGRDAMNRLGPTTTNPSMIGPQAGQAASEVLDRVRAAINTATRPSYDAARQSLVPPSVHAAMRNDPLFVQALDAVRNDPARNSFIRGLSDRSTVVYDAVKQELAERATNLANPVQPGHSNTAAAATGSLGGDVRNIAVAADRNAMGLAPGQPGMGNLEQALADQARLRQQYLEPLQRGPLGRIAEKDITTQRAMDALFPSNPLPNSEHEISTAVQALANRNPTAAAQLVRAHAESTFNEATQAIQSGANPAGGAKFAAQLVGNPQQRANFEAAVTALPHGAERLAGFNRFLEIAEATGTRQNIGSKTAYNAEFLKGQSTSGMVGEATKALSRPLQAAKFLADKYERWQLGHNLNQLADILTNPAAVDQLRAIARMPANSRQAQIIAVRIAALTRSAAQSGEPVK